MSAVLDRTTLGRWVVSHEAGRCVCRRVTKRDVLHLILLMAGWTVYRQ